MAETGAAGKMSSKANEKGQEARGRAMRVVRGLLADSQSPPVDRIIHERMRLAILSALAVNESLTFSELKELLGASDGNLSVHARKLEEAGYVHAHKYFEGRIPKTEYRITDRGREALERYLQHMEDLIRAMKNAR